RASPQARPPRLGQLLLRPPRPGPQLPQQVGEPQPRLHVCRAYVGAATCGAPVLGSRRRSSRCTRPTNPRQRVSLTPGSIEHASKPGWHSGDNVMTPLTPPSRAHRPVHSRPHFAADIQARIWPRGRSPELADLRLVIAAHSTAERGTESAICFDVGLLAWRQGRSHPLLSAACSFLGWARFAASRQGNVGIVLLP